MTQDKTVKPGEAAPISGQYAVIGPRGGNAGTEVTAIKGKPRPPAPKPGMSSSEVAPI